MCLSVSLALNNNIHPKCKRIILAFADSRSGYIAGSNETNRSDHSHLLDEELQATGRTPLTSQQANKLLSLCSVVQRLLLCAA